MDDPKLRAFVERFALTLDAMGLQPMAARVLARFVCSDTNTITSTELADGLGVSRAAISGAIKLLTQAGLVERVPVPGSRRQHFRLMGDAWTGAGAVKEDVFVAFATMAEDGLAVVPAGGPAAARLEEMRAFYAFLAEEMPALMARWRSRRRQPVSARSGRR